MRIRVACLALLTILLGYGVGCRSVEPTAEDGRKARVACVGDGYTSGRGLKTPAEQSYPARLQERLGAYWEVKNFGQARQALVKFDAKVLKKSIEYEPDLVIILIGLNDARRGYYDFAKNFTAYYKALINHYRKQEPAPQIWLCCYPLPLDSDIKPRIEGGINPLVRQIAEETGAVLIDLEDTVPNKADFFGKQGIYPSEHACKLMAREVHRVMMGKAESLPYKVGSWKDRFGPAWDRLFKEQRLY